MTLIYRCDKCGEHHTSRDEITPVSIQEADSPKKGHVCDACKDSIFAYISEQVVGSCVCDVCGYEWEYSGNNEETQCPKSAREEDKQIHHTKTPVHPDYEHDQEVEA